MTVAPPAPILDLHALRAACAGTVAGPGDARYDELRAPWNAAVDQRPAAVVEPTGGADVSAALLAARAAGLGVAVQGTGHAAQVLGDLSGTLLIRTCAMTGAEIDPVTRTARANAGALWQDVVPAAAAHGLAPLAGSSPDVGVVGYTLGGGIGYLARRHGLACNHVTAIEVVTLDGVPRRVDARHEPDLFWALRGGGGRFGVVTAVEFALEPVAELYAGAMFWPWEQAAEVLEAWRALTAAAPDELTSMARLFQFPPLPMIPEPLRGRSWVNVQLAFLGDEHAGAELVAGLRALQPELDMVGPMPLEGLLRLHGDPEGPTPGLTDHALLDALPAEAICDLLAVAGPGSGSPLLNVELRHLGGALGRRSGDAGAMATLDAAYALHTVGIPMGPDSAVAIMESSAALRSELAPYSSDRRYLNFAGGPVASRDVFSPDAEDRLARVRAAADPDGLMHCGYRAA